MVLQRDKPLVIWGQSSCSQRVDVLLEQAPLCSFETGAGAFRATLPPLEAAESISLCFVCQDGTQLTLDNVDIGEVWLAGGQSNMEFLLRYDAESKKTLAAAQDAHLRVYTVAQYAFDGEADDGFKDARFWDKWFPTTPAAAETFPAVAYYFAQELRKTLGVPVGILSCNWGGTTASTWLDARYLRDDAALSVYLSDYEVATREQDPAAYLAADRAYRGRKHTLHDTLDTYAVAGKHRLLRWALEWYMRRPPIQPMGPRHHNSPARLYQSMLRRITGFSCRGVIWYQGESDMHHAASYERLFAAVVDCWRTDWGETLPFLFVQLAPFDRDCGFVASGFPEIRRQQARAEQSIPAAWMVSIMDVGMRHDIHPKKKRPVGQRLALLARGKVYGEALVCQSPQLQSAAQHGDTLVLRFDYAGEGLSLAGGRLRALTLTADGKRVRRWRAVVEGQTLRLHAPALARAAHVQVDFARTPYCKVDLYNSAGLPARPFSCVLEGGIQLEAEV